MARRWVVAGFSCAFMAFAGVFLTDCDPIYDMCLRVRRCSDRDPLVGVEVTTYYQSGGVQTSGFTDPDGEFCFGNMGSSEPPDSLRVKFAKPGYQTLEHTYKNPGERPPWVCLETACDAADGGGCDGAGGEGGGG